MQRLFSPPTPTRSTDSDSPILPSLPSLPLPPVGWSLTSSFANIDIDPPLWSTNNSLLQHQPCVNISFLSKNFIRIFFL